VYAYRRPIGSFDLSHNEYDLIKPTKESSTILPRCWFQVLKRRFKEISECTIPTGKYRVNKTRLSSFIVMYFTCKDHLHCEYRLMINERPSRHVLAINVLVEKKVNL